MNSLKHHLMREYIFPQFLICTKNGIHKCLLYKKTIGQYLIAKLLMKASCLGSNVFRHQKKVVTPQQPSPLIVCKVTTDPMI